MNANNTVSPFLLMFVRRVKDFGKKSADQVVVPRTFVRQDIFYTFYLIELDPSCIQLAILFVDLNDYLLHTSHEAHL